MSLIVPVCKKCGATAACDVVAWFSKADRRNFAVAWSCETCGPVTLVVSPLGPKDVGPDTCVHCGSPSDPGVGPCAVCGVSITEVLRREDMTRCDDDLMEQVRCEFSRGTCRRGLSIANYILQRNPRHSGARRVWADFVEHLDANGAFSDQPRGSETNV